jgi:maltokinase
VIVNQSAPETLRSWIESARWFGGKGRSWTLTSVRRVGEAPQPPEGLRVAIDLAEVSYDDGEPEFYQLPLAFYDTHVERLEHAFIGEWDDEDFGHRFVYDAVHDRDSMALWLQAFDEAAAEGHVTHRGQLAFHRLPGHDLDTDTHSTLFSGEQSNSSVAFGEDSLMKVFRKVTPGVNPDIAIHEVLTRAGSDHVAALYGWLDLVDDAAEGTGSTIQLAMLQQFLRTASDGWDLALASVRNLFAEADLHAAEVGGDFAGEAARLGTALAEVHAVLREHFPVDEGSPGDLSRQMHERLDAALDVVPGLAEHETALRRAFDRVASVGSVVVQQVHGDLHLGQTLRTSKGWKIVDFEGEPAKPLSERLLPDSPWRDVAGMLRSFDYAPRVVAATLDGEQGREGDQVSYRAAEWSERNRHAFVDAYLGDRTMSDDERALLEAYVADKAVYEAVYETRNRPGWVSIPLAALARMES